METSGDRTGYQAVKLQVKAAKLTAKTIYNAITEYIEASEKGEMKYKKFTKQYGGKEIIPVENDDIKGIKNQLKKERIDFSVVKNDKGGYDLYFKGQDINQVKSGLERYTQGKMKPNLRISIGSRLKKAIQIAKEKNKQIREKARERTVRARTDRGMDGR